MQSCSLRYGFLQQMIIEHDIDRTLWQHLFPCRLHALLEFGHVTGRHNTPSGQHVGMAQVAGCIGHTLLDDSGDEVKFIEAGLEDAMVHRSH